MKNKMLIRDNEGKFGHAQLIKVGKDNSKVLAEHYEVRMLDNYDSIHICNTASFLIYYEVMDDVEE